MANQGEGEGYAEVPVKDDQDGNSKSSGTVEVETNTISLKPKISLLNGVTVIVGSIIGSGIFVSPTGVLENTGSVGLALIVWFACGIFSMIGAYCYAELGTMIRKSGADYAYIFEAFGPFLAFLRLWVECMIIKPCLAAIVALTFGYYIIDPIFPTCDQPQNAIRLLAAFCILVLTFINCWDVHWAARVQDVFTYAKVLALVLIIITGFVRLGLGYHEHFHEPFENTLNDVGKVSLAFYSGLFAYNGWNYLNFLTEELKNPNKNLPIAIWVSCTLVMVIYVLANVAYFTSVSPQEMLATPAVAVVMAKKLYGVMWWLVPIFVAMSTFGSVNGIVLTSSRTFYVGARENHMPQVLSMIQIQRLTPLPAVLFTGIMSCVYLVSTDLYALINYVGFVNWLSIGLSVVALLWFRHSRPDAERPIKVALVWPISYTIMSVFLIVVPLYASPVETGLGCLIILTGVPVYLICVAWTSKPKIIQRKMDAFTMAFQKAFLVVQEEKEDEEKSS